MTPADRLRRVMLADCGVCWCGSTARCDQGVPGRLVPLDTGMSVTVYVHSGRVARARDKGLLGEEAHGE